MGDFEEESLVVNFRNDCSSSERFHGGRYEN